MPLYGQTIGIGSSLCWIQPFEAELNFLLLTYERTLHTPIDMKRQVQYSSNGTIRVNQRLVTPIQKNADSSQNENSCNKSRFAYQSIKLFHCVQNLSTNYLLSCSQRHQI